MREVNLGEFMRMSKEILEVFPTIVNNLIIHSGGNVIDLDDNQPYVDWSILLREFLELCEIREELTEDEWQHSMENMNERQKAAIRDAIIRVDEIFRGAITHE